MTFEELCRSARDLTREEYLATYPAPALLVYEEDEAGSSADDTIRFKAGGKKKAHESDWLSKTYEEMSIPKEGATGPSLVAWVRKRRGSNNPFENVVSIGRMKHNDVVINSSVISKVHAVVLLDPPASDGTRKYHLRDQNSTNGTLVDGDPVPGGSQRTLEDATSIWLGSLRVQFILPETLFRALRNPTLLG